MRHLNLKKPNYKKFVFESFDISSMALIYKARRCDIIDIDGIKYRISLDKEPKLEYYYGK